MALATLDYRAGAQTAAMAAMLEPLARAVMAATESTALQQMVATVVMVATLVCLATVRLVEVEASTEQRAS